MRSSFSPAQPYSPNTPDSPLPDLDKHFNELLDALGIKDARRNQMLALPDTSKWMLIKEHQQKGENYKSEIDSYIANLKSPRPNPDDVQHLRVQLSTAPMNYIDNFLEKKGFHILINIISQIIKQLRVVQNQMQTPVQKKGNVLLLECTRCVRALLNTKKGLDVLLGDGLILINEMCLILSAGPTEATSKILILEILAALCILTKDGYRLTFLGMKNYQKTLKEEKPFECLMSILMSEKDYGGNVDTLIACMSLINSIVNSPDDLPSRLRNRKTFIDQGILNITKELLQKDPDLKVQVTVFIEEMNADNEELAAHKSFLDNIDQDDILSIFNALNQQARDSNSFVYFIQFFKHILNLTADPTVGTGLWNQLYDIQEQLMRLYAVGYDGVENILVNTTSLSQVDQMEIQLRSLKKIHDEQKYEINKLRQDSDNKNKIISGLMQQLKSKTMTSSIRQPLSGAGAISSSAITSTRTLPVRRPSLSTSISPASMSPPPTLPNSPTQQDYLAAGDKLSQEIERLRKQLQSANDENEKLKQNIAASSSDKTIQNDDNNNNNREPANLTKSDSNMDVTGDSPAPIGAGPPPPPPPPPPGGGGPPPPPPPPGKKGGKAQAKGRQKLSGPKPSTKLRAFNWTKLPDTKIESTLWDSLYATHLNLSFSVDHLEAYFRTSAQSASAPPTNADADASPNSPTNAVAKNGITAPAAVVAKAAKKQAVALLDGRRANNLCIFLSRLKKTNAQVAHSILSLDETFLQEETVSLLLDFLPNQEEESLYKSFKGDRTTLGPAEQFHLALLEIPHLPQRLRAVLYKSSFDNTVSEIAPDIVAVTQASVQLRTSSKWKKLLQLVLAIGNFLNTDTSRGGAFGFKLDSLPRLSDARSPRDPSMTLMKIVVESIVQFQPDILNFSDEILHIEAASRVSLSHCSSSVAGLKAGLSRIENFLDSFTPTNTTDEFRATIEPFAERAKGRVAKLLAEHETMENEFRLTAKMFGEDEKLATTEEVFGVVSLFVRNFKIAAKEVEKKREKEKQTEKVKEPETKENGVAAIAEKGAMDNIVNALKGGIHFRERRNLQHQEPPKVA
eukprot:TRINITY_DN1197_c0_g2_i1.p1 TRINITY_DN1197_c0_g2~~TRINITY_DN1197_c0_g2_i1.p1  ORF type:complete len:1077 (-),score=250.43 TRINITY_DN1197_c0_g2_i1:7-3237(-)